MGKQRTQVNKRIHDLTVSGPGQSDWQSEPEEEIWGLDLVDMTPDYTKSYKENKAIWARRYKAVYGKRPPWMPESPKEEVEN